MSNGIHQTSNTKNNDFPFPDQQQEHHRIIMVDETPAVPTTGTTSAGTSGADTSTGRGGRGGAGRGSHNRGRGGGRGGTNGRNDSAGRDGSTEASTAAKSFKGISKDMNGHVFQVHNERLDPQQFGKTVEAMADYAAKNLKLSGDLTSFFIDLVSDLYQISSNKKVCCICTPICMMVP